MGALAFLMHADLPLPAIVPTSSGGVQLEWHFRRFECEIVFLPRDQVEAVVSMPSEELAWEVELSKVRDILVELRDRLKSAVRSHDLNVEEGNK